MRWLAAVIVLLWLTGAAGGDAPPAKAPRHIELADRQEFVLDGEDVGSVTAADRSSFTLLKGDAGIVTARGESTVTIKGGTVSQVRAEALSKVFVEGGELRPAPPLPGDRIAYEQPVIRAGRGAIVTIRGQARISGEIHAGEQSSIHIAGGDFRDTIGAWDGASIHVYGSGLSAVTAGGSFDPRTRVAGTFEGGQGFSLDVRLGWTGTIVLHDTRQLTESRLTSVHTPTRVLPGGSIRLGTGPAVARPWGAGVAGLLAPLGVVLMTTGFVASRLLARWRVRRLASPIAVLAAALVVCAPLATACWQFLAARRADAPVEIARPLAAPAWPGYVILAIVGALTVAAILRGKLLTMLTWTCIALFVGLLSLWLRSYRHADLLARHSLSPTPGVNFHRVASFQSSGGGLRIHVRSWPAANGIPPNHSADLSTRVGWEYRSVATWDGPRYAFTDEDVAAAGPFARRWGILLLNGARSTPFAHHVERQTTVTVPYWLITMPLAIPPLLYLRGESPAEPADRDELLPVMQVRPARVVGALSGVRCERRSAGIRVVAFPFDELRAGGSDPDVII